MIVRYVLAVVVGLVVGGFFNIGTLMVGAALIPPPAGADLSSADGWKAAQHLLEPKHFIAPWFAHALGTFVSALIAALIAPSHKFRFAMAMGFLGLAGGIAAAFMIPAPVWFIVLDLVGAYLPVAFLASMIGGREK